MMPWTQSWVSQLPQRWRTMPKRPYSGAAWPRHARGRLHLGELDHGAETRLGPPVQGRQDAEGDLGAGVPVDAPVGVLGAVAAHELVHAGDRGQTRVGLPQDVVGAAEALGPIPEAAAPDIDEPGVELLDEAIALFPAVEGPGPVALGETVGHLDQPVEGLLHLREVVVHAEIVLIDVGVREAVTGAGHGPGVVQRDRDRPR